MFKIFAIVMILLNGAALSPDEYYYKLKTFDSMEACQAFLPSDEYMASETELKAFIEMTEKMQSPPGATVEVQVSSECRLSE